MAEKAKKKPENRAKSGPTSTSWKPGQTGNPGGRPKMPPEEREAWRALAIKSRVKLDELLDDPETPIQMIPKIAEIANNRAWGTPMQSVELTGADGGPLAFSDLSDEDLDRRMRAIMAEK